MSNVVDDVDEDTPPDGYWEGWHAATAAVYQENENRRMALEFAVNNNLSLDHAADFLFFLQTGEAPDSKPKTV